MRSKGSEETEHRKQHNLAQLSLNPKFSIWNWLINIGNNIKQNS